MPEVISFANMKGGVGKTTLCVNLAFELFRRGNRVLIIDNDPQFNASSALLKPDVYINSILKKEGQHTVITFTNESREGGAAKKRKLTLGPLSAGRGI